MSSQDIIYDVDNWYRVGRGRDLQFFATDDEVQEWLLAYLPQEYGPYYLVGSDPFRKGKFSTWVPFEFDITKLKDAMYGIEDTRWNFWIRSKVITPDLKLYAGQRISWILSYNGLVLLHHGRKAGKLGIAASSVGIVDKVKNEKTGEVRHHTEYLKIFNCLRRQIKKRLCYSSIHTFKNGSQLEDTKLQLMTEKAVQAYHDGLLLKNAPGQKIK